MSCNRFLRCGLALGPTVSSLQLFDQQLYTESNHRMEIGSQLKIVKIILYLHPSE